MLFLGQPLSEINLVQPEEEVQYLQKVFSIIKNSNFDLFVKPHPSEDIKKYAPFIDDIQICNEAIPAELLPLYTKFEAVITSSSSAADNLFLTYKLPVFYLHHLTIEKRLDYEKKMNGTFVYTYEELAGRLEKLNEQTDAQMIPDQVVHQHYKNFVSCMQHE
jgi:hypothetical protein